MRLRFSRGSGTAGAIVRWGTRSWCAHVGICLGGGWVIDATPEDGVSERYIVGEEPTTRFYQVPGVTNSDMDRAMDWARSQLGHGYDWTGILGYAMHRDWQNTEEWFCSEFSFMFARKAGKKLLNTEHAWRITPRDLLLSPLIVPC